LRWLAGVPLVAAAGVPADASPVARIEHLIAEAHAIAPAPAEIARRIDYISRALVGARYRAHTLIGGPRRPERLVVRADAFDCVTYCETVLAAALVRSYSEFEAVLKRIRYARGRVVWAERNHYFAEWIRHAVENGICRPVAIAGEIAIEKTVNWGNQGRRNVTMTGIPRAALLANRQLLSSGDIIGFLSRQSNLDFFHTGFVIIGPKGERLLRHASQSRGRVLDQRMAPFLAINGVRHVSLLRAVEQPAIS
jgi:hypothetical protein